MITKVCEMCGKEFQVIPARDKNGRGRYCSIKCRRKADASTRTKLICDVCGKEFYVNKWRYRQNGGGRNPKYCSRECFGTKITKICLNCGKEFQVKRYRSDDAECCSVKCKNQLWSKSHKKENHPQWKGGISFEPYCPLFNNEFKERVRAFFNHTCILCGEKQNGYKLPVHHVDYDKHVCCNGNPPLFVTLCRSCHTKTNNNREHWAMFFNEFIHIQYGGKCYYTKEEYQHL